jgi:hypothetical protein
MQPDPNGTGLVLTPGLRYHGMNPTVTVSMAYELQFGDGLSFYEYLRSNPASRHDPSGLLSYLELLTASTTSAYLRAAQFAAAHPTAMSIAGGLVTAFDVYAFMQFQEVQAIVVSQPNIAGALQAQAAASRVALGGLLKAGTSFRALENVGTSVKRVASAARAWLKARVFGKTGQVHHAISQRIWRALDGHPNLKGRYAPRDPRFVTQAIDKPAHWGYEGWHQRLDQEVIDWIERNREAGVGQFESFLRGRYNQFDLRARFPDGLP